jgi:sporulation protein YlmC with PRC-barrel domain
MPRRAVLYAAGVHVRLSMCIGMPLVDDRSDELLATVSGIFVHPDLGKVEGLFVRTGRGEEFLAASDIAHWGRSIVVRDRDDIAPLDERVRLSALWDEGRPILDQKMVTEAGRVLGTCRDVQFETDTFRVEWFFPRRWLRWKRPVPASAIVEARPEFVRVRDMDVPVEPLPADRAAVGALEAIGGASTPAQG